MAIDNKIERLAFKICLLNPMASFGLYTVFGTLSEALRPDLGKIIFGLRACTIVVCMDFLW